MTDDNSGAPSLRDHPERMRFTVYSKRLTTNLKYQEICHASRRVEFFITVIDIGIEKPTIKA
jgi:hypothetical protein